LKNTSPLVVAIYSPVEIIATIIFAIIILDVELEWQQGIGAGLIVGGLLVVLYAKKKEEKEEIQVEKIDEDDLVMEKRSLTSQKNTR